MVNNLRHMTQEHQPKFEYGLRHKTPLTLLGRVSKLNEITCFISNHINTTCQPKTLSRSVECMSIILS